MEGSTDLWRVYLEAKIEVFYEESWYCISGCAIKRPCPKTLYDDLVSCSAAFILTAWNPYSVVLEDHENEQRNQALEGDLVELRLPYYPARGSSRSDNYSESGFLVIAREPLNPSDLVFDLARKYDQAAIYEIVGGVLRCADANGSLVVEMEDLSEALLSL